MNLDCMVWLTGATVLGFVFGHWLGTRWGLHHADTSQKFADFWQGECCRLLEAFEKFRASHPGKQP